MVLKSRFQSWVRARPVVAILAVMGEAEAREASERLQSWRHNFLLSGRQNHKHSGGPACTVSARRTLLRKKLRYVSVVRIVAVVL